MGKAKQKRLPGVEGKDPDLESLANDYVDVRDRRMGLTKEESDLRGQLLKVMRQKNRMTYKYEGLVIERVPGEETVHVRVDKAGKKKE